MKVMQCKDVVAALMDIVDNALPHEKLALYQAHLEKCPRCREFRKSYEATTPIVKRALQLGGDAHVPGALRMRLLKMIHPAGGL